MTYLPVIAFSLINMNFIVVWRNCDLGTVFVPCMASYWTYASSKKILFSHISYLVLINSFISSKNESLKTGCGKKILKCLKLPVPEYPLTILDSYCVPLSADYQSTRKYCKKMVKLCCN